jgi:hypothetical protein
MRPHTLQGEPRVIEQISDGLSVTLVACCASVDDPPHPA